MVSRVCSGMEQHDPRRDRCPLRPKPACPQIAVGGLGLFKTITAGNDHLMAELNEEERDELNDSKFAFPMEHKEPLEDATHVRNAIARFDQVKGVSDAERDQAWQRIKRAAKKFDVEVSEKSWRDLKRS